MRRRAGRGAQESPLHIVDAGGNRLNPAAFLIHKSPPAPAPAPHAPIESDHHPKSPRPRPGAEARGRSYGGVVVIDRASNASAAAALDAAALRAPLQALAGQAASPAPARRPPHLARCASRLRRAGSAGAAASAAGGSVGRAGARAARRAHGRARVAAGSNCASRHARAHRGRHRHAPHPRASHR